MLNLDIDEIIYLYCEKKCSLRAIAKVFNCHHNSISLRLREHKIPIRPFDYEGYYECRRKYKLGESKNVSRVYRVIMGNIKKRPLKSYEHVHHRNFDRTNNSPENLFLFEDGDLHLLYHGFVRQYGFITPEKFLDYYNQNLKDKYNNYDWLYNQYIITNRSINEISKILGISRLAITNKLKNLQIFNLREVTINQYIQ